MSGKLLIGTVGLPRSGKSTWCQTMIKRGFAVVNPDSIRLALTGQRFYGPAEPTVWATAKLMVNSLFIAGHDVVVLDATNTQEERRREWLSKDFSTRWVTFPTPIEVCRQRAKIGRAHV